MWANRSSFSQLALCTKSMIMTKPNYHLSMIISDVSCVYVPVDQPVLPFPALHEVPVNTYHFINAIMRKIHQKQNQLLLWVIQPNFSMARFVTQLRLYQKISNYWTVQFQSLVHLRTSFCFIENVMKTEGYLH